MDKKQQYLSVKEVAEEFEISQQAVYKKLNNQFKPYLKIIKGKKRLNINVLELKENKEFKPVSTKLNNQFNNQVERIIDMLEKQNKDLKDELDSKENQLNKKDKQIEELNKRLSEAHQLTTQAQQIHVSDKVLKIQEGVIDPVEQEQKEESKSFMDRFFKKK